MPMVDGKEYPYTKKGKTAAKEAKLKMRGGGEVTTGFPDLTGDGKVTRKDILKGRGVQGMKGGGYVEDDRVKMMHGGDVATESAKQGKGKGKGRMTCRGMGAMVKGGSFTIS
jgi:hypothetical protein